MCGFCFGAAEAARWIRNRYLMLDREVLKEALAAEPVFVDHAAEMLDTDDRRNARIAEGRWT